MQELVVTACAPSPIMAAHSASNALHSGPCVRIGPSSTRATALRSSSVIQGRPNGMSVIVGYPFGSIGYQRVVGRHAGGDEIELVASRCRGVRTVENAAHEGRDERALAGGQR